MKTTKLSLVLTAFVAWMPTVSVLGQDFEFDTGSNESDGDIVINENTVLSLPPDGIFHTKRFEVGTGVTLSFEPNALNTPVVILASGQVLITGNINITGSPGNNTVGGLGGPGGGRGGYPGAENQPPGDGHGIGGGIAGEGGRHAAIGIGNLTQFPPSTGSGGGGSITKGGGGGGGSITIGSRVRIVLDGTIIASGGVAGGGSGPGSGGSVRFVAPTITGRGSTDVAGAAARGWVRFDVIDPTGIISINKGDPSTFSIGSNMAMFPPKIPRLNIIRVAGRDIAEPPTEPVTIVLPFGSDPTQSVILRAHDFDAVMPITVAVTPLYGPRMLFEAMVDNLQTNPADVVVAVELPINVAADISAWTRPPAQE